MAEGLLARFAQKQPGRIYSGIFPFSRPDTDYMSGPEQPQKYAFAPRIDFAAGVSGDVLRALDIAGRATSGEMVTPRQANEVAMTMMGGSAFGRAPAGALATGLMARGAGNPPNPTRISTRNPTAAKRTEDPVGGMVKAARGASRGLRANDLPEMLDGLGYKYNVENSQFMSDQHGPSLSSYYTVETPSGAKRFRVSDHADGALVEGRTDLRLGANADEQMLDAFNALGVDAPQSVVDGAALSRSERLATQQKRNAAILDADTAAKRARVETQAAELAALGAGHLTGRSRRQAIAALNMKSDRKKRQAIAEIVAADLLMARRG